MEHNQEEIIREKIRMAEQTPALWDRGRVKASIGIAPVRSGVRVYYMAASILLAVCLSFILWQWTYRLELELRLSEVHLEIEKQGLLVMKDAAPSETICPTDQSIALTKSIPAPKEPTVVTIVRIDTIRVPAPADQITRVAEEKTEVAAPVLEATHQPEAIIGRSVATDLKSKDRKFRLLLFRGDEPEPLKEPTAEPIAINNRNK
jgi:hypothetical protein